MALLILKHLRRHIRAQCPNTNMYSSAHTVFVLRVLLHMWVFILYRKTIWAGRIISYAKVDLYYWFLIQSKKITDHKTWTFKPQTSDKKKSALLQIVYGVDFHKHSTLLQKRLGHSLYLTWIQPFVDLGSGTVLFSRCKNYFVDIPLLNPTSNVQYVQLSYFHIHCVIFIKIKNVIVIKNVSQ